MIIRLSSVIAALLAFSLPVPAAAAPDAKTWMVKAPPVKLEAVASSMPVWFEPNLGQVAGRTEWTSRAAGAWLFLTSNEVVYALPPEGKFDPAKTRGVPNFKTANVHMRIVGGRRVKGVGEGAMGSYSNYFVGKHEDEWFTGVPHFERVRYAEVYPGIDLVYYATGRSVEYDFIVAPEADPSLIELAFDGVEGVRVDKDGDLVVSAGGKSFRQHRPRVFQGSEIEASYRITEQGTVKVDVGEFDPLVSLRVDPVLDFATYLGGPGEDGMSDAAIAPDGTPVILGRTQSPQSPTLDPFQQPSVVSLAPIVLKMSADGRRLLFYTILGRNGWDAGVALAVDREGSILVGGMTRSASFPLKNQFQSELKAIFDNGFVTRITADGRSIVHSSYLGGSNSEAIYSVTVDSEGNAYFAGNSQSNDFPLVKPLQARSGGGMDGIVSKVGPDGQLLFSTYLGGESLDSFRGIAWREDDTVFVTGESKGTTFPLKNPLDTAVTTRTGYSNPVLVQISTLSDNLLYSTYFGNGAVAGSNGISIDKSGNIYVAGGVSDRQFPLRNALFAELAETTNNGFVSVFAPDGRNILFSTFIPGAIPGDIGIDSFGAIYISGSARSPLMPLKDSLMPFRGGGILNSDHFVMKLAPAGRALVYSTLLGGRGNEEEMNLAVGPDGTVFVAGKTGSLDYPMSAAYQRESGGSTDGVFARITDNSAPVLPSITVLPAALSFRYVQNDPPPTAAMVAVQNLNGTASVQVSHPWLRVSPATLTASGAIQISIDPSGLSPGTHRGSVSIVPPTGVPVSTVVSLNLLAPAPVLTGIEPGLVSVGAADTEITIYGSGFTNLTTVQVDTIPYLTSMVRFIDGSTLKLTLPRSYFSSAYNYAVTVQNPDSATSKSVSLTVGRPAPAIASGGIVSAASFSGQVISPGEIVTIFGENFEPGMQVTFDNVPATPFFLNATQLSVTVPYAIAGAREVAVIVSAGIERRSVPVRIPVWPARPGLFTANSSGSGQGAILNQDGSVNSVSNPAVKGSIIVLYGTGGGPLAGTLLELPVKVFVDGMESEVLYAGAAPGLVDGAIQVNVRIPQFAVHGEVILRVSERESQASVTVALR